MSLDTAPSAATSYARTLISKGCPPALAQAAAEILARDIQQQRSAEEQAIVTRAWSTLKTRLDVTNVQP